MGRRRGGGLKARQGLSVVTLARNWAAGAHPPPPATRACASSVPHSSARVRAVRWLGVREGEGVMEGVGVIEGVREGVGVAVGVSVPPPSTLPGVGVRGEVGVMLALKSVEWESVAVGKREVRAVVDTVPEALEDSVERVVGGGVGVVGVEGEVEALLSGVEVVRAVEDVEAVAAEEWVALPLPVPVDVELPLPVEETLGQGEGVGVECALSGVAVGASPLALPLAVGAAGVAVTAPAPPVALPPALRVRSAEEEASAVSLAVAEPVPA